MPWREEAFKARRVPMRPGVKVGTCHQPGTQDDHGPFEPSRRWEGSAVSDQLSCYLHLRPCQLSSLYHHDHPSSQSVNSVMTPPSLRHRLPAWTRMSAFSSSGRSLMPTRSASSMTVMSIGSTVSSVHVSITPPPPKT